MIYIRGHRWTGLDDGVVYFSIYRRKNSSPVLCLIDDVKLMSKLELYMTPLYRGTVLLSTVWIGGERYLVFHEKFKRMVRRGILTDYDLIRTYRYDIKELEEHGILNWHYLGEEEREA